MSGTLPLQPVADSERQALGAARPGAAPPPSPMGGSTPSEVFDPDGEAGGDAGPEDAVAEAPARKSLADKIEAYISRLSTRNTFWHRVCSLIWLPYAFKSGIKVKKVDDHTFSAVLPFRRFNRNWYNAMAGAALLANSEIAGGMYVFGRCGGDYTVVCKELTYKFLRPCFGPAIYRVKPQGEIDALIATGREFNLDVEIEILQQIPKRPGKEYRVGRCRASFHVTPKSAQRAKRDRKKGRVAPAPIEGGGRPTPPAKDTAAM
ncbi:MAG: hypothetical protein JNM07_11775 [Phycisphaerae bacterium]|nr:hypothetical protein [Phycisphaerae bacterium]